MPVFINGRKEGIVAFDGSDGEPKGKRPKFFWETQKYGVPRYDDLMTVRMLENTHTARLPMDTIIKQATTTPFSVRPTVDDPTPEHWEACEEITNFLQGGYNVNGGSFDHLLKALLNDVLSIDAGVIEKVPDSDGFLAEIYVRDGATFTKNPDKFGRLPPPNSDDAAYYQFGLPMHTKLFFDMSHPEEILNKQAKVGMSYRGKPQPFTRSQIVWVEENPRSWQVYGHGRVQTVKRLIEIILNQDLTNLKYFPQNEVPEGLVNLVNADKANIQRFREYWKDEIKGKKHKVGLVGGQVEWIPFRPSPEELEFIKSQEWYNKLCWMAFGLNQAEVGDLKDVNRATSKEQNKNIFRKTTAPLLNLLQSYILNGVVTFMRPYHEVNGEVEFVFEVRNPEIEAMQRTQQMEDLKNGLATPNQVLQERGKETVPWGDYPLTVFNNLASQHVDWMIEHVFGETDPPQPPAGGLFSGEVEGNKGDGNFFTNGQMNPTKTNKDALRNQRSDDFPPMKHHVDKLSDDLGRTIRDYFDDVGDDIEEVFKSQSGIETKLANIAQVVGGINLVRPMLNRVLPVAMAAMDDGATHQAGKTERRLLEEADEPAEISLQFDVKDTFAFKRLKENAARNMRHVNTTIKSRINRTLTNVVNEGGGVNEAIDAIQEEVGGISENHAELIARTEILGASRHGTQAFCESSDLIAGKRWIASSDNRTREWHAVMNQKVVRKDDNFVVPDTGAKEQPNNYPREAYVVGEDQPFNCRCAQQPVLKEDLPKDLKTLGKMDGVTVTFLNTRQKQVFAKKAKDGERFVEMLERYDANHSRNKAPKRLNISKPTYYSWMKQFNVM